MALGFSEGERWVSMRGRVRKPGGDQRADCAVRTIGDTSIGTAQTGGEPERGGGPPLSVGVRGEGRALALHPVQVRGPSPRTEQRGGPCSHYSALRSKRKGIRFSRGASAGDDVFQLAVTVSGAPAADALQKAYEP